MKMIKHSGKVIIKSLIVMMKLMLVPLIAISPKAIIPDYDKYSVIMMMGTGLTAPAVGYYFIRSANYRYFDTSGSAIITKNVNEEIE